MKNEYLTKEDKRLFESFSNDLYNTAFSVLTNYHPSEDIMRSAVCRALDHRNFYFLESVFFSQQHFRFDIYGGYFYTLRKFLNNSDLVFLQNIFEYFEFNEQHSLEFIYHLFEEYTFTVNSRIISNIKGSKLAETLPKNILNILEIDSVKDIKKEMAKIQRIKNF